jgi:predicted ATPase
MRLAKVGDYKRRLRDRAETWELQLRRFAFSDVPSLGTAEVALSTPFTILSGPNGVGKTTVLRALWATAAADAAIQTPGGKIKLTTGTATLDYTWQGISRSNTISFTGGTVIGLEDFPTSVVHLDSSVEPLRYQEEYCGFETTEDVLNGIGGIGLSAKTLDDINYISKRDYKEITLYEVEGIKGTAPFFEVHIGSDRYDSRTMGAGELSVLHTWWHVNQSQNNSLMLIEEPETFLSPASQTGLAHFLLAATVDKNLVTIITSHSPQIVDSVADNHRLFLYRQGANARFALPPVSPVLLKSVGILPKIDTVMMVEDKAGEIFLSSLLEKYDPGLRRRTEVIDRQGDGNIVSLLERINGQFKKIGMIGVFDGDLRGNLKRTIVSHSAFLPGDRAIEIIFKQMVLEDIDGAAEHLSRPKLAEALFELQGADHHDWYNGLCENLNLTVDQLFPPLFNLWMTKPGSEEAAAKAIAEIHAALGGLGAEVLPAV